MTNPFDDQEGTFRVLVNSEEQYSIWPSFAATPEGWTVAREECSREEALSWVDANWTDMRPRSLRERAAGATG